MSKKLTEKQLAMLEVIKQHISDFGFPPTTRKLQEHFNFASVNAVQQTLLALEKKGFLRRYEKGSARGYEVVGWRPDLQEKMSTLPLLGGIAAGTPIMAYENVEGQILVDTDIVGASGDFALRVRGNSMIDAGIHDGDIIIIQQTEQCANGEIVVALLNDEATVKRFFKEVGGYRLQPENPEVDPILVDADDPRFRLIGRVKALIRRF